MSLTSPTFLLAMAVLVPVYYLIPRRLQWMLLLAASCLFYLTGGPEAMAFLLLTALSTWLAGLCLGALNARRRSLAPEEKARGQALIRRRKRLVVLAACLLNFGALFLLKYWNGTAALLSRLSGADLPELGLVMPLGLSFYIFQSVGYVVDVYRDKYAPQRNPARHLLFVSFFPQMIQGPISRWDQLAPQLLGEHPLRWEDLRDGLQLAMWGYMKKLLIAERIGVAADAVFADQGAWPGSILAFGVLAYSLQLYCDFSGGIDIARAAARLLGVDMAENFRRPLFARSLADFWRRWHISLGSWMRDYLFYPLSLSKPLARLGRWARRRVPGKAGKILATSLATFVVYLVIGVWHGSSLKYIAYGLYNGGIITASLLLEGTFVRWRQRLGITESGRFWTVFRVLRTNAIVFIGRYLTRAPRLLTGLAMLWRTAADCHPGALWSGRLLTLGLGWGDYLVVLAASALLFGTELAQERGLSLREGLAGRHWLVQWGAMFLSLLLLLFLGLGGSYTPAQFIYAQF